MNSVPVPVLGAGVLRKHKTCLLPKESSKGSVERVLDIMLEDLHSNLPFASVWGLMKDISFPLELTAQSKHFLFSGVIIKNPIKLSEIPEERKVDWHPDGQVS